MGKLNLLKGNWYGKVGETVGAKWKNKSVIRTYAKPSNPDTKDQQKVRSAFGEIASFVALFADGIKYLSAFQTGGMSVRNAILKANRDMINDGTVNLANLVISRGGLQKPENVTATKDDTSGKVTVNWADPTATNFSEKAQAIIVIVSQAEKMAEVITADYDGDSAQGSMDFSKATDVIAYLYFLDKRGSSKVGSASAGVNVA